ncbi:hypothetical protein ACFU96_21365 [Streptomyces sp. NPDC057620]|uniref:hypothetical protein n=1 Tax=Streptomyces sp. NPDC057620 TaxID=3346185 RepID=UPI0036B9F1F8
MPRIPRLLTRRPRPAAILAAGAATLFLGTLGALGASPATPGDFAPPAPRVDLLDAVDGRPDIAAPCRGEVEYAELCATVAARPAYSYVDADGATQHVPDGRTMLAHLYLPRGSQSFHLELLSMDAEYVERALDSQG